jgi:excisionase family DNA binding protein
MVERIHMSELRDDLRDGVGTIADYTGLQKRKVYYLIEKGVLPIRRLGHRTIIGRKSQINAALRNQDQERQGR